MSITINVQELHIHQGASAEQLGVINHRLDTIMSTLEQATAALAALTATVSKISTETSTLLQKIADLTAIIDAGGAGNTTSEFDAALVALTAQVNVVDALVPDAPVTVPPVTT